MKRISEFFFKIVNKFKNNWGLKILSFVLAIILWNTVIIQTDPMTSRTTAPLPVTILGSDQLDQRDLALLQPAIDYLDEVRVTVSMKRSQSSNFDENEIRVDLDLSRITGTGKQEVKLSAYTNQGSVERISPESITVNVDDRQEKVIPVECLIEGTVPDDYFAGERTIEPNIIQISGPTSIVSKIEVAQVSANISDRETSLSSLPIEYDLINKDLDVVDSKALNVSVSSIMLSIPITPRKELLIIGDNAISGQDKLPEGYEIEIIEVYPNIVEVTGPAELLDGLTSLPTEVIDIASKKEDVLASLQILVPDGINLLSVDTVSVAIRIKEIMNEVKFENISVEYRNIPEGLKVDNIETILKDVMMSVPMIKADTLTLAHVRLYVDLTGISAGENSLIVQCDVGNEFNAQDITVLNDNVIISMVEK